MIRKELMSIISLESNLSPRRQYRGLSFFLYFFLLWGGTRSLRIAALRPASQAGPMHNPIEGTSVVLRHLSL